MTKQAIIEHTTDVINQLSENEAAEIARFADLLILLDAKENNLMRINAKLNQLRAELTNQLDELAFNADVQSMASNSAFDFLKDEEELYTESDLKEVYGKR